MAACPGHGGVSSTQSQVQCPLALGLGQSDQSYEAGLRTCSTGGSLSPASWANPVGHRPLGSSSGYLHRGGWQSAPCRLAFLIFTGGLQRAPPPHRPGRPGQPLPPRPMIWRLAAPTAQADHPCMHRPAPLAMPQTPSRPPLSPQYAPLASALRPPRRPLRHAHPQPSLSAPPNRSEARSRRRARPSGAQAGEPPGGRNRRGGGAGADTGGPAPAAAGAQVRGGAEEGGGGGGGGGVRGGGRWVRGGRGRAVLRRVGGGEGPGRTPPGPRASPAASSPSPHRPPRIPALVPARPPADTPSSALPTPGDTRSGAPPTPADTPSRALPTPADTRSVRPPTPARFSRPGDGRPAIDPRLEAGYRTPAAPGGGGAGRRCHRTTAPARTRMQRLASSPPRGMHAWWAPRGMRQHPCTGSRVQLPRGGSGSPSRPPGGRTWGCHHRPGAKVGRASSSPPPPPSPFLTVSGWHLCVGACTRRTALRLGSAPYPEPPAQPGSRPGSEALVCSHLDPLPRASHWALRSRGPSGLMPGT